MRTGLIGTKIGMTQTIADDGKVIPTTVIKLGPCLALEKKVKNNKISLKIGYEDAKPRLLTKSKLGYLSKLKVKPIKYVKEFDLLNPEIDINPGAEIKADIFKEGDIADVTSKSKGRGFAGVIKRHNFAGLRHTHGTPQNQRSGGSIGACAYPGRVWKGQKMAGRYGGKNSTIQGLKVLGIGRGDEVIVPNLTFAAVYNSVIFSGAKPILNNLMDFSLSPRSNKYFFASISFWKIPNYLWKFLFDSFLIDFIIITKHNTI